MELDLLRTAVPYCVFGPQYDRLVAEYATVLAESIAMDRSEEMIEWAAQRLYMLFLGS